MAAPGGGANIGEIVGQRLLSALEAAEEQLDDQLHRMDKVEHDEDEMERIRRARLDALKRTTKQKSEWLAAGHGV
jgi:hypothetical protein